MQDRQSKGQSALVVNLDIKDNHEEAASGAKLALELCQMVRHGTVKDTTNRNSFLNPCQRNLLHRLGRSRGRNDPSAALR
jgi:hypothetical protein